MTGKMPSVKKLTVKKLTTLGLMLTLSLILSYLEAVLIPPVGIPGIKLGLANVLVVILLYLYGPWEALIVNLIRILISGVLFTGIYGMIFSIAGGLLSFAAMASGKKCGFFNICGVSILGGTFHDLGQIAAAVFLFSTAAIWYYLPFLLVAGVVTGALNGFLASQVLRRLSYVRDIKGDPGSDGN